MLQACCNVRKHAQMLQSCYNVRKHILKCYKHATMLGNMLNATNMLQC